MKLNHISKLTTVAIFAGVVTFSSCKKDNTVNQPASSTEVAASIAATQDDAVAESQYDDVFNITMGVQSSDAGEEIGIGAGADVIYSSAASSDMINTPASPRCFTVSVIPNTPHVFPKTITIDFGAGCIGRDGKLRKRKIVSIYTGPMFIPGSKTSTTFVDYSVDSFKIEGTHTVENTSASNKKEWTVKVIDGKITNTNTGNWGSTYL